MSAEPVHTGHETISEQPAEVYPFRRPRRQRRETPVPPQPESPLTPQQKLAATLERRFGAQGHSLTDEDTAADFLITLAAVRDLVAGARAQGVLGEEEYTVLEGMVDGMMDAPRLLA